MEIEFILLVFLIVCSFTDLKYKKVYNIISLPTIIIGFVLNFINYGTKGVKHSLIGAFAGFIFLFLFFLLDGVGAGDIKFLIAIGSLKGAKFVINGIIYGAIFAGIFTFVLLIYKKLLFKTLKKIFLFFLYILVFHRIIPIKKEDLPELPYVFFLSIGMLVNYF